ncbi:hypothetical protein Cs7R123_46190 [Catellatospora sp. TT07R-123]|uniref:Imm1 family immunity protein n=1 Tax=Catellatospora sp. TT07R-123 TaxID=2733863 RepID=UPI001B16AF52|nr:Imm1 family immunity protein [Catellatospora sp. TT07R-123]GHJ47277.1 hypothetical protein Cs7R123_46190 [Catellatospora sp. TT07R-123]
MILNVFFRDGGASRGKWHHGETRHEMLDLVSRVMANLAFEDSASPWVSPGEDAWFCFAETRYENEGDEIARRPTSFLRVSVNRSTQFGALIWFAEGEPLRDSDGYGDIWVSENPVPPSFDPRVVADPGFPTFHSPRSTIQVSEVENALLEFCRAGTGRRPQSIQWAEGDLAGRRADETRSDVVDGICFVDDPWA